MNCGICGRENALRSKYCKQCGRRLSKDHSGSSRVALTTPTQSRAREQPPQRRLTTKAILGAFVATMSAIGGMWVLYDLRPKIQIACSGSLDESSVFETRFSITNLGYLSLHTVESMCTLNEVDIQNGNKIKGTSLRYSANIKPLIVPGDVATVVCPFNKMIYVGTINSADVTFNVQYYYPLWLFRLGTKARFVGQHNKKGETRWFQQPIAP
jgi:hypothetical protein